MIIDYSLGTMLHRSARYNNLEITTILINKGANVNITNNTGKTPVLYAY
jgi:ankyrin repeat protein